MTSALHALGVENDEIAELLDMKEFLERLAFLLPPGEVDDRASWTLPRAGRKHRFLEVDPSTAEVQCRRSGPDRALTWVFESSGRMAMGRGTAPFRGRISGDAALSPEGLKRSSVRETWRMDAGSMAIEYQLQVLPGPP